MLQTQTVTAETLALIKCLMADEDLKDFALVGGTALALHMGHRVSIYIDLFSIKDFNTEEIARSLSERYKAEDMKVFKNGIFCFIDDVKVDLVAHQYPLIKPVEKIDEVRLLSIDDIGAMKLHAIVQSGQRLKDFADVYAMLEHRPLEDFYRAYEEKYYPNVTRQMAQQGLLYHSEIDLTLPVNFLDRVYNWPSIAARLKEAVIFPKRLFTGLQRSPRIVLKKSKGNHNELEL